jgi:branched-chain amino acid transport system permease protein
MRCGDFRTTYAADEQIFETLYPKIGLACLGLALAVLPGVLTSYWLDVVNRIGIAIVGAVGLNILTGFAGQISIGHAAFLAVGAYATANLAGRGGLPFWVALPAAGLVTALVGMIFGVPSLRLKGLYLAMATLAAHFIVEFTVQHWDAMTGGVAGMPVAAPRLGTLALDTDARLFYVIFAVVVGGVVFAKNLFRTRVGRAFVAIRDRDVSAEVMGVNLFRYKLLAFGVSSFYAGLAGGLLAYQAKIITPENFPIGVAIDYLAMIIIGGLGSILGSVLGAVFMTLLPEVLRLGFTALSGLSPHLIGAFASIREGVFGLLIIVFLIFEPDGLAARWRTVKDYFRVWPFAY